MAFHVWQQLQNFTDVKSFLGLCGFYQRFVADYATVATPLTNLMGKKAVWKWGEEEERAFQALKVRLLQYPVLTVPNFKLPMILHTDASDVGVGATLSQKDEGKVFAEIAEDGSRVLLVTPHWQEPPWYELLLKLTVRSYEWRGKLYLTEGGNLRPNPKWYTLLSNVVGKRRRLTKEELAEELAGEQ